MVKSVKRCLHWHVISRLIYNSIIDIINLIAGPWDGAWDKLTWGVSVFKWHVSRLEEDDYCRSTIGWMCRELPGVLCPRGRLPAPAPLPPSTFSSPEFCIGTVSDTHSPVRPLLSKDWNTFSWFMEMINEPKKTIFLFCLWPPGTFQWFQENYSRQMFLDFILKNEPFIHYV